MKLRAFPALFACVVLGGLVLRGARLSLRPMHHDEANQALKFGALLETGEYRYDPREHHGPTLYYLTLPLAKAAGGRSLADVDETLLRLVPALFGTGLILLFLLFGGGLARESIAFAAVLAAVSPLMTYYSRFYIQESLLVFFTAGLMAAGWRYARTRSVWSAAAAGFFAGLACATKETSLIIFAALIVGVAVAATAGRGKGRPPGIAPAALALHAAVFLATALAMAALFFTSFLSNPSGLADSVRAFGTYAGRGLEGGVHAHPWWYYLKLLLWTRYGRGPVWSEAFVMALAVAGAIAAFGRDTGKDGKPAFIRFLLGYTLAAGAAFSLIPYKTPWNAMPFYLGVILLAGHGAGLLWRVSRFPVVKLAMLALLLPGFFNLGLQDFRANFRDYADTSNPYVYAQTSKDLLRLARTVEGAAEAAGDHKNLLVAVVAPADETWPLPWYLRRFELVGYWNEFDPAGPAGRAEVVICSLAAAEKFQSSAGAGFVASFYELRPGVLLELFVRDDVWEAYLDRKTAKKAT
jgi:uncharacterized protein (TIGR03663 family)